MDVNMIIKLLDAGYTKSDIDAIASQPAGDGSAVSIASASPIEPLKVPESKETGPSTPELEQPAGPPDSDKELEALTGIVNGLTEKLEALTQAVHKNNIINSEQPAKQPEETVSDILAALINPYYKKEK